MHRFLEYPIRSPLSVNYNVHLSFRILQIKIDLLAGKYNIEMKVIKNLLSRLNRLFSNLQTDLLVVVLNFLFLLKL